MPPGVLLPDSSSSAEHLWPVQIVNWLAQFKPKQLSKQQLVKPILESLCKLCAEPEPEDHDQDDQLSANKFASQVRHLATVLCACCNSLPRCGCNHAQISERNKFTACLSVCVRLFVVVCVFL